MTDEALQSTRRPSWVARVAHRLGVRASISSVDRMPWTSRLLIIGVVAAAAFAVFGLPPVSLPMPTFAFGVVTPTCGLTRASTALARGDVATAWAFNPAVFLVALWTAAAAVRLVLGRATGRWLNVQFRPTRIGWAILGGLFVALWMNQQSHADLIMHGTV